MEVFDCLCLQITGAFFQFPRMLSEFLTLFDAEIVNVRLCFVTYIAFRRIDKKRNLEFLFVFYSYAKLRPFNFDGELQKNKCGRLMFA